MNWTNIANRILEGFVLLVFVGIATILYDLNQAVKDLGSKIGVVTETVRITHEENKYFRNITIENTRRLSDIERKLDYCCGVKR